MAKLIRTGATSYVLTAHLRPGHVLSILIYRITGQSAANCARCTARAQQMDEWGWLRCLRERRTIIAWLIEEAQKRGHAVAPSDAGRLLRELISEARVGKIQQT